MSEVQPVSVRPSRSEWIGLAALFAAIYFIQGIGEPTEGLVGQPVRSLMRHWGKSSGEIGLFFGILGLPWMLKILYGFILDTVPLWGTRRRGYLLLTNGAAMASLLALYFWPPTKDTPFAMLLVGLLIPTIGIAFADVAVDALMVEKGQPLGLTGRLQSVQWTANYVAMFVLGYVGGWLSEGRHRLAFLIAGCSTGFAVLLTFAFVRERRVTRSNLPANQLPPLSSNTTATLSKFRHAFNPSTISAAAFLFLWNFNPFASSVLQTHMTESMKFTESFFGRTQSIQAVGAMLASIAYGVYCRHVRFSILIHVSILAGVLATASYWLMHDKWSAQVVAFVVGFTYLTGMLIQMELAARVCPIQVAGTTFALLMSISNAGVSLSQVAGGYLYDYWTNQYGAQVSYNLLVGLGASASALCWLLVPMLIAAGAGVQADG